MCQIYKSELHCEEDMFFCGDADKVPSIYYVITFRAGGRGRFKLNNFCVLLIQLLRLCFDIRGKGVRKGEISMALLYLCL